MTQTLRIALSCAALLCAASAVSAQDAVEVDPDHYSVIFENDQVRVLRITYGPDEISVMHTHPASVVVPLTPAEVRFHLPDGSAVDATLEEGVPGWSDEDHHQPHNIGEEPLEAILVELKKSHKEKKKEHEHD